MNQILRESQLKPSLVVQLVQGDITTEKVDAIVNAANAQLAHGGGLAGVISRQGGRTIQAESDTWVKVHGLVTHEIPAYTSGGNLSCRYIIHAVGPVWGSGDEDYKLAQAVAGSLRCADELELTSIALPAISTGIFSFPIERAAGVILKSVRDYFHEKPKSGLKQVKIVLFDQSAVEAFQSAWDIDN